MPSERIAQIQRLIASEGWTARPERDLAVAYIFWTAKAQTALAANKYPQAEQLAAHSLRLRPDQPKALLVLALSRFAQANFSGAAEAFRKILEIDKTSHPEIVAAYAQALAASDRKGAIAQFHAWAQGLEGEKPREVTVSEAGLELIGGAPDAARRLEGELRRSSDASAPSRVGELARWEYLAANYEMSVELLTEAHQLRPGDGSVTVPLAWSLIEVRRYADALQVLEGSAYEPNIQPEKMMARAVTRWQAHQQDEALVDFRSAVAGQPEWENSNWVHALYSPLVAQSIQEMQAERERRKRK